jgi:signal transduction histidine kinase
MLAFLLRDIWFRLCLIVWLAVAVLYLTPVAQPSTRAFFGDYLIGITFIPLVIACCLAGVSGRRETEEPHFWRMIAGGYFIWFAYGVVTLAIPDTSWTLAASVGGDVAYVAYYLLFLLAIELKPHLQMMNRVQAQQRRLRSTALTLLLFAWLCYIVVIPAAVDRRAYETLVPSFLLYLSLDLILIGRLMWVRRESWSVRWAALYGLLAAAVGAMFIGDVAETLYIGNVIALGSGTPADLLWTLPFMLIAAAARARHAPLETGQDVLNQDWEGQRITRTEQWLMGGAILLPIAHQTLYALGWLDASAENYRRVLVEVTLVSLAILALLAFRLLEADRRLVEEREAVLRRELDQARRMDAVARVAGAVAHDFSNLLHVIRGRVDLVTDELDPAHPAHDDLREIRAAAMRASAMAADLLAFGRRQPVATEPLSLHTFIDELRRQMKLMAGERAALTITLGATEDRVSLDAVKFESVLLNLVANARNAMPGGGRIEIETWNPDTAPGVARRVALAVRDSGQGMSAEVLDRAFEPFFTTRRDQGGSGMGLSSAHGIIQAMGGSIRADSTPGKGTTILIELPVISAPADTGAPGADAAPERPRGALLIMETDSHMRQMLRGYFADVWKPVLTSGNAMEALQIAGTPGQAISILVTDTSPSGLTYDVLVARLKALHPKMHVVLIVPEDFAGPAPDDCLLMREPLSLTELADKLRAFER